MVRLYVQRVPVTVIYFTERTALSSSWNRDFGMIKYSDFWRKHRRLFHQYFRSQAVSAYHAKTGEAVRQMLRSLMDSPEEWLEHIHL